MAEHPQPARVRLSRTKGWRMPENTVRVARPSIWGNPFKVGGHVRFIGGGLPVRIPDAATAVALYRGQFGTCVAADRAVERIRAELKGKNLACWCPLDQPCHADVLLELANSEPIT